MNAEPQLLDVVELVADMPGEGRLRGEKGTVVECFSDGVYLVEFEWDESDREHIHEIAAADLRVVWRVGDAAGQLRSSA